MSIGLSNYKFGRKNNWRRWSWNRCIEYSNKKPSEIVCIYLPSKQNIDMIVAESKGIDPYNMYAVEKNVKVVKNLRKRKINVIHGELHDILNAWGVRPKIDVIHADFCSSLNNKIILRFGQSLIGNLSVRRNTVVVLNLLRGRDADSNCIRQALYGEGYCNEFHKKHRGFQFLFALRCLCIANRNWRYNLFNNDELFRLDNESLKRMFYSFDPFFNSYKSINNSVMDSVVFRVGELMNFTKQRKFKKSIKNKIAAAKAIRTMRLN